MISVEHKGDFSRTINFLNEKKNAIHNLDLDKYGARGVEALSAATPVRTGRTAKSWSYTIEKRFDSCTISFRNSNIQNGVPIAIILQYGHGTKNGGYVEGIDYINPALKPVFKDLAENAWREVSRK